MKQLNMVLQNSTTVKTKRKSAFSKMLGGAFAALSMLFAFSADATHIPASVATVNAGAMTPTSSCVVGNFAAGWQTPGSGYWDFTLNTTGFTSITMTFKNQKSSAAGPTLGSIYYNTGGADVFISSFIPSTSCPGSFAVVNLPVACENVANLHIKVKMTGATSNTATHRITADPFDGVTSSCTGTPTAGSVTAGANPICAGTSTTLTLGGASAGGGITYQWQSSPNGSTWTSIAGATNLTYNTPVSLGTSTYYRAVVTCPSSGMSANTASFLETVNSVSFGAITGLNSNLMIVNDTDTVATTPAGGLWQSSNTSRATIDAATGVIVAKKGGVVTFTYSVVDPGTGCVGTIDTNVNIVWPNTLALYVGDNGTSTNVINVPGDAASAIAGNGFAGAGSCTSGGVSFTGATASTFNVATNPYVSYTVTANPGQALNIFRIHATTRESGTGPTKARLGYRVNGSSTWVIDSAFTQATTGSCGAATNSWDWGFADTTDAAILGASSIEVGIFPYGASASGGVFQVNQLEVYGVVSSNADCGGFTSGSTSVITPSPVHFCDSGSIWLNYDYTTGIVGPGIAYQWQQYNGSTFVDIAGENSASYNTRKIYTTTIYRVKVTCSLGGGFTAFSAPDTVFVNPTPSAGTITGIPTPFMHSGDVITLSATGATPGGVITWSSNDTTAVGINRTTGDISGFIPGFAVITAINNVNGCFGTTKDSVRNILPSTVAVYVGKFGNSTGVDVSGSVSGGAVAKVGTFGTTTSCQFGGLSGMTIPAAITSYNTSNPHVSLSFTANETFTVQDFAVTLRRSNSGPFYARLAYRVNGGAWTDDGIDEPVDQDDCGYSQNAIGFGFMTPLVLNNGDNAEFAVFPYNDATQGTGGAFQVNTIDITSSDASSMLRPTSVANAVKAETIKLFPNPATDVLNIVAAEKVNVTILSIDGKKLIEQKNATSINISTLANGLYMIQIADANNKLIETAKFTKQ